jgi:RNA polymerase sigma-70 factor (ECF subfamily)
MHTTPVSLLQRLRQSSAQTAWSRFVELYTPLLFSWARRCGLNDTDAADLVQDVFTHLIARLPEFQYDRHAAFAPGCAGC